MKTRLLIAGAVVALTACNSTDNTYNVTADFGEDYNGKTAVITNFDNGATIDSVLIADGKAVFTDTISNPVLVRLLVDGKRHGMFILEADSIKYANGDVEGGDLNGVISDYFKKQNELQETYGAMFNSAETDAAKDSISSLYYNIADSLTSATMDANINNPVGYYLFLNESMSMEPAKVKEYLAAHPALNNYTRIKEILPGIEAKENTSKGKPYTDFSIEYNGETKKLSDYVKPGQYTLVDFWASWCGPCRREIKVIKELYDKYSSKGLNVVGVAVWDEPEATEKAIAEDGIKWNQIINAQKIPTDLYGINGIPCILLIGPDGVIVERDLFDDELVNAVTTAMEGTAAK